MSEILEQLLMWLPHPWKRSGIIWTGLGATWTSRKCPKRALRFPPAHPGILCFSPPGDSQLRARRVWDHHPLGLCHGCSPALWEHPAGEEAAGHPPRAPFVSPCSPGICDNLGITAGGWEQHRDTHTDCLTLLQFWLSTSHFQLAAVSQMAPLPSQPAWREDFPIWTNYPWQSALSGIKLQRAGRVQLNPGQSCSSSAPGDRI